MTFLGVTREAFKAAPPSLPHHCHRRAKTLAGRGATATAAASFSCCQIKRTDSPFSAHSAHTMGEGDQRQNYKCEPLMHQVEQWASETSALSRGAVQLVLTTQCHGKKPHCPGEMLPRMKTPSSSFLQLPNGKQNNKPGPQLNKHATNQAELKCNRRCCSWTRLGAGSKLLGHCYCKGFFATPQPSPSINLCSFFSSVPFPCSCPPLGASLPLVPPDHPTSSQCFIHHRWKFSFLNTQNHRFYFRRAQEKGKSHFTVLFRPF